MKYILKNAKKDQTKTWFLKRWTKLINLWPGSSRNKRTPKSVKSEMKEIITDTTETQRILRGNYMNYIAIKQDILEEVENFQETYNFPRSNQKVENMNKLISSNKLNLIKKKKNKKLPTNKHPGPDGVTCELYQTCREELTPFLLKQLQKLQRKECFWTHSTWPASMWHQNQTEMSHTKNKATG